MIRNMSKICLYLTFAIVLSLFAATSLANPKPDEGINIIINEAKSGAMLNTMPKVIPKVGRRLKKMMKGTMTTNIYSIMICTGCLTLKWIE